MRYNNVIAVLHRCDAPVSLHVIITANFKVKTWGLTRRDLIYYRLDLVVLYTFDSHVDLVEFVRMYRFKQALSKFMPELRILP